ncbi:hypothetical protein F5X98DRAFT_373027 [Xylaria grammica]|nr:hypothetical protein F5X98DRAFT_373027 [Xylaria grammica]
MKITACAMAMTAILLTSTGASAIFSNEPSATQLLDEIKDANSPGAYPQFPPTPNAKTDINTNAFEAAGKCNREACQTCIRGCGGLGRFSCFYFKCMNTVCRGCRTWNSQSSAEP